MRKQSLSMQAKGQFLELCAKGDFVPGEKIPSEAEMSKLFNVSRETWRKALDSLRRDGVVFSKHGAGSYLLDSTHKIENDLSELRSLSEMIRNAGIVEVQPKLTLEFQQPSPEVSQLLQIPEGESVCVIRRTRYSEAEVLCNSINYIPWHLADEIDPVQPPTSIFEYFQKRKEIYITRSATKIEIPDKHDPDAGVLQNGDDSPILTLKQLHFDSRGNPTMYSVDYLRGDLFEFSVTRTRYR